MQHTFWRIDMNMGQEKAHYNYCRHVRKEHAWIAGRHFTYKHFINKKILINEQQISDVNPLFELAKVTNTLRLKP